VPGPSLAATARRLPGIRFEAQPPPPADVLPRMDIAAFVGFAATGPLHVPVAVEDMAAFTEVFGPAAPLFWDPVAGEQVSAHLAPVVRAYFRNGGRRCWVVRVADRRAASRSRLPVPGLAFLGDGGLPRQAELHARAAGSWADGLAVSAGLLAAPLELVPGSLWADPGAAAVGCLLRGRDAVRAGDLVRVIYPAAATQLLFVVASVSPPHPDGQVAVTGAEPLWLVASALGTDPEGPPVEGTASLEDVAWPVTVTVRDEDDDEYEAGLVRAELHLPIDAAPQVGALVRLDLHRGDLGPALLLVAQARAGAPRGSPPTPSSVLFGRLFRPSTAPPPATSPPAAPGPAQLLSFELRARLGEGRLMVLGALGFHRDHPRHAGVLPTDEQLYGSLPTADDPLPPQRPALWEEAATPRFPLAGIGTRTLYPVGMDAVGGRMFVQARPQPRPALERDGLGRLHAGLFLDAAVAGAGTATTMETADFLRYHGEAPRDLVGVHALLGIEEVSLVAVPDAVHLPWRRLEPPPVPPPPDPEPAAQADECGHRDRSAAGFGDCTIASAGTPRWRGLEPGEPPRRLADRLGNLQLAWDPVADATGYVVEESADERTWGGSQEVYLGPATSVELRGLPPGARFYRVRALVGDLVGDWSEGVTVMVTKGQPWTADPLDPDPGATLRSVHRSLVRMCAARGDLLAVLSVPRHYRERDVLDHVVRLRGAERFPGGGTDAAVPPLGGEERTLSFGAVYHPWPVAGREDRPEEVAAVPPDGAATGILARRALLRGAWVAPANEVLTDVVALVPAVPVSSRQALQDGRVNTVRQEPVGFLWLSADTLSDDPDLRQVNVRRLLSLLRRVALRHGPTYVFEPNDEAFRRRVRRGFEALLGELLARGAFAGTTPEESFQVSTSGPANTPQAVDQGRLVVELKVAPSIPMRFLTVRLVHSGDQGLTVEGV
jgi:hypothetical protein